MKHLYIGKVMVFDT